MTIPETTPEKPYIEFTFDEEGKLTLAAVSYVWGEEGFIGSDGSHGNACEPEELHEMIRLHKERYKQSLENEIIELKEQLKKVDQWQSLV